MLAQAEMEGARRRASSARRAGAALDLLHPPRPNPSLPPFEVATRAQTAPIGESDRALRSRGRATSARSSPTNRIFPARSDVSPGAFFYSPPEKGESWPPREWSHVFGHFDTRALAAAAPHAFGSAHRSISPTPPASSTSRPATSSTLAPPPSPPSSPWTETPSDAASSNGTAVPEAPFQASSSGDVSGRRKALERVRNPKPSPYKWVKPLGQPAPAFTAKPMVKLNRVFDSLQQWTSAPSKSDPAWHARECLRLASASSVASS